MAATAQKKPKSGFYNDLFDTIIDLPDSRQMIDDTPATINFIDYDLFSENAIEDHIKQIIDDILKDINYSDILMQYTPSEKDIKIEHRTPETLDFIDILMIKRKKKNHHNFLQVKQSVKNVKKLDKRKMTN